MNAASPSSETVGIPVLLFFVAATAFLVSMWAPMSGASSGSTVWWESCVLIFKAFGDFDRRPNWYYLRNGFPDIVALMSLLALLANSLFGWLLRRRHAVPMLMMSFYSLVLGLLVPILCEIFDSRAWKGYENLGIGYWTWIASLSFVSAGWGSIVWNQRQLRNSALSGEVSR
jgi:hypothetical protein